MRIMNSSGGINNHFSAVFFRKTLAILTALTLVFTDIFTPFSYARASAQAEVVLPPADSFVFEIPEHLGTVDERHLSRTPFSAPLLIHLQTAHGDYGTQKNIQQILEYLCREYGIKDLLLEGAGVPLAPDQDLYFSRLEWNREVMDYRARQGWASGASLFLLETVLDPSLAGVRAFGVESAAAYRSNRELFRDVLRRLPQSEDFLGSLKRHIERFALRRISKPLYDFLRAEDAFHAGHLTLEAWLKVLRRNAIEFLHEDPWHPRRQREWPRLVRLAKLGEIESRLDLQKAETEAEDFLRAVRGRLPADLYARLEGLLAEGGGHFTASGRMTGQGEIPATSRPLPGQRPRTDRNASSYGYAQIRAVLEETVSHLPQNFSFEPYAHLKVWLQARVFRNEIEGGPLFGEIRRLAARIKERLAREEKEKQAAVLFEDYRKLRSLLLLELSPAGYEEILAHRGELLPSAFFRKTAPLDDRDDLADLDETFAKALSFYQGAREREKWIVQNALARMREQKARVAILITGGFHVPGLRKEFLERGFSYALVTPAMTTPASRENYLSGFLEKTPPAFSLSEIEDGAVLPFPNPDAVREHGLSVAYYRDIRLQAIREVLGASNRLSDGAADFNQSRFAETFGVESAVSGRRLSFRQKTISKGIRPHRAEVRTGEDAGLSPQEQRLKEWMEGPWYESKEELRRRASDTIMRLWPGEPLPSWTQHLGDIVSSIRQRFEQNRAAGVPTTFLVVGLSGTGKSSIAPVIASYFLKDEAMTRAGLKAVHIYQGDRSRYEVPPGDLEVDGRTIDEFRAHLQANYPEYLRLNQELEKTSSEAEQEVLENKLHARLQELNEFNARLQALGLRPLEMDGSFASDVYRQFDIDEQSRFWAGVKNPSGAKPADGYMSFFDVNSRGRWRIRLSREGKLQFVFRLKKKIEVKENKQTHFRGGDLVAEITDEVIDPKFLQYEIEDENRKANTVPKWKLVFKEGERLLTLDEVSLKTEFFESDRDIKSVRRPFGVKKQMRSGFEIVFQGTTHTVLIPRHKKYFHVFYEGIEKPLKRERGETAPFLTKARSSSDSILMLDWNIPVAIKHFDGILILENDPLTLLAKQAARYDENKASISRDAFIHHLQRAWRDVDPWLRQDLETIRKVAASTPTLQIWRGSTMNREDVILRMAQAALLDQEGPSELLREPDRFFFRATDFPGEEERFEREGPAGILQEKMNAVPEQVVREQLEEHGNLLEKFMTTKQGVIVLKLGDFLFKGKLHDGVFGESEEDLKRLQDIRTRGNGLIVPFTVIDFKGEEASIFDPQTQERERVRLGKVLVHVHGMNLQERRHELLDRQRVAELNGQKAASRRYEREVERIGEAADENDAELKKRNLINRTPERKWTQKLLAPDGRVWHSSFSSLEVKGATTGVKGILTRLGAWVEEWGPPVPNMWTWEIDRRQRLILTPMMIRSKIREINAKLREDSATPGQEDVQGWWRLVRWTGFILERVAYRNTHAAKVIEKIYDDIQEGPGFLKDLETPGDLEGYVDSIIQYFSEHFSQLREETSLDRIVVDLFRQFRPRYFQARAVILDYHNVLFQSANHLRERFRDIFGRGMRAVEFERVYSKIMGDPEIVELRRRAMREDVFNEYLAEVNRKFQAATGVHASLTRRSYLSATSKDETPDPGALAFLERLRRDGIPYLVLTDQYAGTGAEERVMANLRRYFAGHFDRGKVLFSFDEGVHARKEEGAPAFQKALRQLGLPPREVLLIDDRSANIEGGRRAGLQTMTYDYRLHYFLDDALIVEPAAPLRPAAESRAEVRDAREANTSTDHAGRNSALVELVDKVERGTLLPLRDRSLPEVQDLQTEAVIRRTAGEILDSVFLPEALERYPELVALVAGHPDDATARRAQWARQLLGLRDNATALILDPELALDQGGLALVHTLFGRATPVAVVVRGSKDRRAVAAFNRAYRGGRRTAKILTASGLEEAAELLRRVPARTAAQPGGRVVRAFLSSRSDYLESWTLATRLRDVPVTVITPEIFDRVVRGTGIGRFVSAIREQFRAIAKSA